jgi:hypothetical protein
MYRSFSIFDNISELRFIRGRRTIAIGSNDSCFLIDIGYADIHQDNAHPQEYCGDPERIA